MKQYLDPKEQYLKLHEEMLGARSAQIDLLEDSLLEKLDQCWKIMPQQHKEEINKIIKEQVKNETIS